MQPSSTTFVFVFPCFLPLSSHFLDEVSKTDVITLWRKLDKKKTLCKYRLFIVFEISGLK